MESAGGWGETENVGAGSHNELKRGSSKGSDLETVLSDAQHTEEVDSGHSRGHDGQVCMGEMEEDGRGVAIRVI